MQAGHRRDTSAHSSTPFLEVARDEWAALAPTTPLTINEADVLRLRSLGDPVDIAEVREVYVPLSRLLNLHIMNARELHRATSSFVGERSARTPFVIGVAGSVAVGKSTVARPVSYTHLRAHETTE